MNAQELNELADRLADITEDAHGNPKPIDLSDRQEAARQLRHMAEVEGKLITTEDYCFKVQQENAATHRKIQEWWWLSKTAVSWCTLQSDMESFMRERGVPLEKP